MGCDGGVGGSCGGVGGGWLGGRKPKALIRGGGECRNGLEGGKLR